MLQQPITKFISSREVVLTDRFEVDTSAGRLIVESGATSDGSSIPSLFTVWYGFARFEGDTFPASFAHDQLYAAELVSRDVADRIFHELLRESGVGRIRAWLYYVAVRSFGAGTWKKHTPQSVNQARRFARLEAKP